MLKINLALVLLFLFSVNEGVTQQQTDKREPIIDMHMHTYQWNRYGDPPPPNYISRKIPEASTDSAGIEAYLAEAKKHNIILAVGSAQLEMVKKWSDYAPDLFIPGIQFPRNTTPGKPRITKWPDLIELRKLIESGEIQVLGEILAQFAGIAPNDPILEPYFALAEELDIPVCYHTGFAEPMTPYHSDPEFRLRYGNPLLLEDVLIKHPNLRIYIAHGGYPCQQETISLMMMYQQVYMDISAINWLLPQDEFHDYLKRFFRVYLGKRIMFGSDQMIWPDAVGMGIKAINSAAFLSDEQKRDILYNNAANFLRLDEK